MSLKAKKCLDKITDYLELKVQTESQWHDEHRVVQPLHFQILTIHNPYKLRHDKYMLVNPDRYPYLTEHMENSANKTTNFKTFNRLFWHYLKLREVNDDNEVQDIHIEYFNKKLAEQGIDSKKQMKDIDLFHTDNNNDDMPF